MVLVAGGGGGDGGGALPTDPAAAAAARMGRGGFLNPWMSLSSSSVSSSLGQLR